MIIKKNRFLLSETDVFTAINNNASSKIDLSFVEPKYHIDISNIKAELELIRSRNYPLLRLVLNALETKKIILCNNGNLKTSVVFVFGATGGNISTVFINMSRYVKTERGIDPKTGNIVEKAIIQGGYEELYTLLLAAYCGLNAQTVYRNAKVVGEVRNIYADIFSQLMSKSYGNPLDGETFRFIVSHYFYNGDISGQDLGMVLKYNPDRVQALMLKYPGYFDRREFISFNEFIDLICKEFPSLARNNLDAIGFIINAASKLGDNAVYCLDNAAYLLAVMVAKGRKSKVFNGYMLKPMESDAASLLSAIYQSLV